MSFILNRRAVAGFAVAMAVTGCDAGKAPAPASPSPAPPVPPTPPPAKPQPEMKIVRSSVIPGGYVLGKATPGLEVAVDGSTITPDDEGYFFVGIDRSRTGSVIFSAQDAGVEIVREEMPIAARQFKSETIEVPRAGGIPVSPEWYDLLDQGLLRDFESETGSARQVPSKEKRMSRAEELELKKEAFASRAAATGYREAWTKPVNGRESSGWGSERILVKPDRTRSPQIHWGVDIAAVSGTPVLAPASGVIALAQPDMTLEGGCVFIDHGLGLISAYLHMSEVLVEVGQTVRQGDPVGSVGAKGRATGSHLCWRLRFGELNLDAGALVAAAPAR